MSKVSEVKVPTTGKFLGKFHIGRFNLFDDKEVATYEELRTRGNDRASGVTIEHVQQFTRVVTETESTEAGEVTKRSEDLYILVQWWERSLGIAKEHALSKAEPPRDWYLERDVTKDKDGA